MYKKIIQEKFSQSAQTYDSYAKVQKQCAEDLALFLSDRRYDCVLDVGCGTGWYTQLLIDKFPQAKITAVDISLGMLQAAREKLVDVNVDFFHGRVIDLPYFAKFDLITSNAALHWVDDIAGEFNLYKQFLSNQGLMLFSIFGPRTFWQLQEVLKNLFNGEIVLPAANFYGEEEIKKALGENVFMREKIYSESYQSFHHLLKTIKYTGTGGSLKQKGMLWTPRMLEKIERKYRNMFGQIKVDYQVFFVRCV